MNSRKIVGYAILVAIVGLIVFGIVWSIVSPGEYDEFAACLKESGAKMYGTDWCKFCKQQKALFGKSFKHAPYVNCDYSKAECAEKGIQGYPTWIINEKTYSGVQQLERLSSLTGCSLVQRV